MESEAGKASLEPGEIQSTGAVIKRMNGTREETYHDQKSVLTR